MKRLGVMLLCLAFVFGINLPVFASNDGNYEAEYTNIDSSGLEISANSAMLIEANTGVVLYQKNQEDRASPASVTKIMTLLLVMESIESGKISLSDKVRISPNAASMGGSQVFLEEGEEMGVEDLIKCAVIASANDASVALAEHVAGSESAFVRMMNEKAATLGLQNTSFENVTGLDDSTVNHYTSAEDIATMSKELIKHSLILKYSSIWQDTIRNGEFTLTNTNRLVRYYDGCTGLKTGSTDKAGYCISVTAERDGMSLIAVIMGADTRDNRNKEARELLDFGFANYALFSEAEIPLENVELYYANKVESTLYSAPFCALIPKGEAKRVKKVYDLPKSITAPIKAYEPIGSVTYMLGDEVLGKSDVYIIEDAERIGFFDIFLRLFASFFGC